MWGKCPTDFLRISLTFSPLKVSSMGKGPAPDYLKSLGSNLRKTREARGLSLRDLAALCNTDHSDIGKMERGETNITILTLIQISKALGVHPKEILDFEIDFED